jgi:cardiolipin synthase
MVYAHNLLSGSRLMATPVVASLAAFDETRSAALVLSILVALTDFIDGPIARRTGGASPFGALLDMTSDKVFLCSLLVVLAVRGESPVWLACIMASRELLVLFLRVVAAQHNRPLPIATCGKLKTFMLYLLVPLALADAPWQAVWFLAYASSASALSSLVEYVVKMRADLAQDFFCTWAARKDT